MPFKTVNPATGELVRSFEEISDRDLELVLGTAHKAYETDWRLRPVAERARIVARAATILRERADEYAGYLTLEMSRRRRPFWITTRRTQRVISSRSRLPRHPAPKCAPIPSE
jgi:acyl-CoA reductase-like NAD-dependent aldehyde dehydrogenase